jgi:Zn-dependent peptidase ImmA (M78 family)
MRSDTEASISDITLVLLGMICNPGVEALKLQRDFNVRSLEDIPAAAGRVGCEICYVDLPLKVSGFVAVIAGTPHIVVNRAKSPQHQQYTLAHELGHQVLHVNPVQDPNHPGLQIKDMAEFQAHMFASTLMFMTTNDKEREDVLMQNPESLTMPALAILATVIVLVIALLFYLCSRLFPAHPPTLAERE